jgi:hypothetical protein
VLVLLAVIVGLLVIADLTARSVAEAELADRVRARVPEAERASVDIASFPFLGRLLASGNVGQLDARVSGITVRGLRFDFIAVELHGVRLDRDQLVGDRRVVVEGIERGEARAEVPQAALSDALGVPIMLEDGRASVEVLGRRVSASLAVEDGTLVVGGVGLSLPGFDLVAPLLPCVPDLEILAGRVVLACDFTEIPRELLVPVQL